ncbi:MAG: preprotein translocase subunit YajC [Lachnospiraceae bacterium]|nr:preprotein translocase subunit YajC [Lachnospiraceae bacterium]
MGPTFWIMYIVFLVAILYFMAIRPQQKQKKQFQELMAALEIGDSVKTTSGFYGVVIDITDDMVIVEFGSNKNCRIPMDKAAIVEVEKANQVNTTTAE